MAQGKKTGGRQKGSRNKPSPHIAEIAAGGIMPLDYMLEVLRNDAEEPGRRAWAAKEAAPYIHPKLAQVEHGNKGGKPFEIVISAADAALL